jgi:SAM-dependent methyltransferase
MISAIRAKLSWRLRRLGRISDVQWSRVVMDQETARFVRSLDYRRMDALEISGAKWKDFGFASYRSADYPEYDWCERPLKESAFDIVIAEQVLEHVLWPYRAVRHAFQMLRPGGVFVVSTPFLLRVHNYPVDCSRWTPLGMKHLLAEAGFPLEQTITGSWGNRACVRSNFRKWTWWVPWLHSLRNEPDFPIVVWAFGRKPGAATATM